MSEVKIPVLVISLLDLNNTTSQVPAFETLLKRAYNNEVSIVPLYMEPYNEIYYRDKTLTSFTGRVYSGQFDDNRMIRAFIGEVFQWLKIVLPGREKIYILHSGDYEAEAQMLEALVKGQQLQSETIRIQSPDQVG